MSESPLFSTTPVAPLVRLWQVEPGAFKAEIVGLPEIQATGITRAEVLLEVRHLLSERLCSGELVPLAVPGWQPLRRTPGWANGDQLEREFLADLAQSRQEDLERTLGECPQGEPGCSSTSSTPTT